MVFVLDQDRDYSLGTEDSEEDFCLTPEDIIREEYRGEPVDEGDLASSFVNTVPFGNKFLDRPQFMRWGNSNPVR